MNSTAETSTDIPKKQSNWFVIGLILLASAVGRAQILPGPLPIPGQQMPAEFSLPVDVSSGTAARGSHKMAVDSAGNINIAWVDDSPGHVFFVRSTDHGVTFSPPRDVSNSPAATRSLQLAVGSGGTIYIAWFDYDAAAISFVRSTDGGDTFAPPISITTGADLPALTLDPHGNIYLCWLGFIAPPPADRAIFYSRSTDDGATFSPPEIALNLGSSRVQTPPLIAVDSSANINVAWIGDFLIPNSDFAFYHVVFFTRSNDAGATFSALQAISDQLQYPPTLSMSLDPLGGINILWESVPRGNVYLSRSINGGTTFLRTQVSQNPGTATPEAPQMALDERGNLYVAWMDNSPGTYAVFFRAAIAYGSIFLTAPHNVSNSSNNASTPGIALGPAGDINVVWTERSSGISGNIFFSRSANGGANFSTPQNLSNNSDANMSPLIALDTGGNIDILWQDLNISSSSYSFLFTHGIPPGQ